MKTAISIPDAVFQAAEELAEKQGLSRSALYTRAVERLLADEQDAAVTDRLNEVYTEPAASALPPDLLALQLASLGEEEW